MSLSSLTLSLSLSTVVDDVENHRDPRKVTITHELSGGGYDAISAVKTITISDSEKRIVGDGQSGFNIPAILTVDEASSSTPDYGRTEYTVKLDPSLPAGVSGPTVTVTVLEPENDHIRIASSKGLPSARLDIPYLYCFH